MIEKESTIKVEIIEVKTEKMEIAKDDDDKELKRKRGGRLCKNVSTAPTPTDCIANRTRGRPSKSPVLSREQSNQIIDKIAKKFENPLQPDKKMKFNLTSEDSEDDTDFLPSILTKKSEQKKKSYRCRFCNFKTCYKNSYLIHMERYENTPGNFVCRICDESFPFKRKLKTHWKNHVPTYFPDGPKKPGFYECEMCNEKFKKRYQLGKHRTVHRLDNVSEVDSNKVNRCGICRKRFYSEAAFHEHMEQATNEHKPVECDHCKKTFKSRRQLIAHLRIHVSPLICHICGSRKYSDASMKVHIRRHNKDYYIHCNVCNKGFYNKSELRLHMISHTSREANRPFVCQTCGRSYRSGCYLKLHMKIAHIEAEEYKRKRYKCDICDFETHLAKCLKIHKQTHTGENLITCEMCNKLINKRYMTIHIRTHTGEKPFVCTICGKGFNCKKNLVRHNSRKHKAKN